MIYVCILLKRVKFVVCTNLKNKMCIYVQKTSDFSFNKKETTIIDSYCGTFVSLHYNI